MNGTIQMDAWQALYLTLILHKALCSLQWFLPKPIELVDSKTTLQSLLTVTWQKLQSLLWFSVFSVLSPICLAVLIHSHMVTASNQHLGSYGGWGHGVFSLWKPFPMQLSEQNPLLFCSLLFWKKVPRTERFHKTHINFSPVWEIPMARKWIPVLQRPCIYLFSNSPTLSMTSSVHETLNSLCLTTMLNQGINTLWFGLLFMPFSFRIPSEDPFL